MGFFSATNLMLVSFNRQVFCTGGPGDRAFSIAASGVNNAFIDILSPAAEEL